jgi:hypothetical protein
VELNGFLTSPHEEETKKVKYVFIIYTKTRYNSEKYVNMLKLKGLLLVS